MTAAYGLEEENLNDEFDEEVHEGEEGQAGILMHGNEDVTDIFFFGLVILDPWILFLLFFFSFFVCAFNFFSSWPLFEH